MTALSAPPALSQVAPPESQPAPAAWRSTPVDAGRWTSERIWKWYQGQPWPCGFNYIPAHSISYTEMFMPYNFDAAKIDRELARAKADGFNCARVVLPFVVWEHDPAAFKQRLSAFLAVCARNGIRVMPALFDDCVFGHTADPIYGRQPVVVPGWYANGWTPSPGHAIVRDRSQWPRLERYVRDIIGTYKDDARIWIWDLYNEPTNSGMGEVTVPLVEEVFDWARDISPTQPLTCDVFGTPAMQRLALDRSDIVTFHNYDPPADLLANINQLQLAGRPIICTEWLNRPRQSTLPNALPIFKRENVGSMHWGYINGRTQTNFPWGARPGPPSPKTWQHDLYRSEFTVESVPGGGYGFGTDYDPTAAQIKPYDPGEIALFKKTITEMASHPRPSGPAQKWIVPTALMHDASNLWRYTTQQPAGDWMGAAFGDAAWKSGLGGFGTDAPNSWPRTDWDTEDIWLRRVVRLGAIPREATLWAHHDEDIEVFLNGQLIHEAKGFTQNYVGIKLSPRALALMKAGDNILAVRCHQTTGGQYVDVGLSTPRQP